jgi:hypothetical protein
MTFFRINHVIRHCLVYSCLVLVLLHVGCTAVNPYAIKTPKSRIDSAALATISGNTIPDEGPDKAILDTGKPSGPPTSPPSSPSPSPPPPPPTPASLAYLGYAYPPKIQRGETRIFYAYVSVFDTGIAIIQKIKDDALRTEGNEEASDTIILYPQDISFYRSVHLSLTSPSGDFQITPEQTSDTQVIDPHGGAHWQWTLTTTTDKPTVQLLLKAEGMREGNEAEELDTRIIPIRIMIESNPFRAIYIYLLDHPAVSVPAIFAFLGFIGWLIKYRLSKGKVS